MNTLRERYRARIAQIPESIIMQRHGYCGLACTYCYLPDKDTKTLMTVEVAEAVAASVRLMEPLLGGAPLTVIWHAGEPLSLGRKHFVELLDVFEELRARGVVRHSIQTNATLINDAWLDLFEQYDIQIGVSIDGPAALNSNRVDRLGRPAFAQIMRGIERLRERGVPFTVISVVTAQATGRAHELLDFLASLGPQLIGLNIEELEGPNADSPGVSAAGARLFWQDVLTWVRAGGGGGVAVREADRLGRYLSYTPEERREVRSQYRMNPIPTVSVKGDVVLLSPELAGISSETYGDFVAGNVLERDILSIVDSGHELQYVQEFLDSLDNCQSGCGFFDYCLGSQASPRFFEHGSLVPSETRACQTIEQALVEAFADTVKKETA